ncbi:type VII secretion-associated serine protease mycosin [Actinomycetospora endophytica]|uniref:Type VII secretion-associated serine protease mycosin n=1 Tax=Actinomycetospora endophytica TaxID=2291215 RepID=A0ABS8P3B4_9PSEU|nr:type VII secretion-associated serine protease mycosin [Actinomycetospora endophytica]MCD2192728.1 type VII secretion-associated serine protease mycosin [Actinomycetospora endophytica]
MTGGARAAGVLLGVVLVLLGTAPASAAVPAPPAPDPALLAGLDPTPSPLPGVRQQVACVAPLSEGPTVTPWAQERLRITDAWRWGRGAGQTVAVIDTGVATHPRLAGRLLDGGDFVGPGGTGTTDCDGHGTLVAGIVAAAPDPAPGESGPSGFTGVAPEARVLTIRQSSATATAGGRTGPGAGDVVTLARAVRHAVDLGATVVNISEAACLPVAVAPRVLAPLRAAVRDAVDRNVVVVAAAGNAGSGSCEQTDPSGTEEGQVVAPAWFGDDVLSVGYVGQDGRPSPRTVRGPWVSVAAPGTDVVSLSPTGPGLVDRVQPAGAGTGDPAGSPIEGSSFAAPYVAGVAALVRARFPQLSARQVTARIVATAQAAGPRDDAVGAGIVDPVAALSTPVAAAAGASSGASENGGPGRVDLAGGGDAHSGARAVALIGTAGAVVLGGVVLGAVVLARRARRPR